MRRLLKCMGTARLQNVVRFAGYSAVQTNGYIEFADARVSSTLMASPFTLLLSVS